ncbi:MAG: D-alanine--D-alanine ligase family protein [Polyangiaceae bacterium]
MSARQLSVAVVQGGPSTEAEVSRASAAGIEKALARSGHNVRRLELDASLAESLRAGKFDVVFPVAHGAVGENGSLQGLLEVLEIPYVGSDVLASALAMHKRVARVLFERAGLPVALGTALRRGSSADARAAAERMRREIGARLVVKPSSQGSAIGVVRLDADAGTHDVARAIEAAWEIDEFAIVEHFACGREVTCGVLDLDEPRALAPTEIISPMDPFYTYEARYAPGRSLHECPAVLPPGVAERVQSVAVAAHEALGCRDLSRVDFVVGDEGAPEALTLLEINTLPGMTETSLYPEAAFAAGFAMPRMCDALVARAHARGPSRRAKSRPLPR